MVFFAFPFHGRPDGSGGLGSGAPLTGLPAQAAKAVITVAAAIAEKIKDVVERAKFFGGRMKLFMAGSVSSVGLSRTTDEGTARCNRLAWVLEVDYR